MKVCEIGETNVLNKYSWEREYIREAGKRKGKREADKS